MVQISDLFSASRFPGGVSAFILFLYFPAGLLLALLRALFSIQFVIVLSILPKHNVLRSVIIRICGFILGFVITSGGKEEKKHVAKLMVANHVSAFDCLVIESIEPVLQPYANCDYLPSFLCWILDYICQKFSLSRSLDYIRDNEDDFQYPILTFPEETTTNGSAGLLKFNPEYVNLCNGPVQPVALSVSRPSTSRISISVIEEHFWLDLFWTFFVPFTHYHVSYLPPMIKSEEDSDEDFAKRIQRDIAYVLDLAVTPFSLKEKKEFIRKLNEASTTATTIRRKPIGRSIQTDPRLEEMTKQVKDVFPQCPIDIVRKDIVRTKDVNLTLTNILEGRVSYQPLSEDEQEEERMKIRLARQQLEKVHLEQDNNGQVSFQEKKRLMIAEARRKYLEKHPELDVDRPKQD